MNTSQGYTKNILKNPDGSEAVNENVNGIAFKTSTPLASNGSISTGWIPYNQYGSATTVIFSDVAGTILYEYSTDGGTTILDSAIFPFNTVNDFRVASFPLGKGTHLRMTFTNGAIAQSKFYFSVSLNLNVINSQGSVFTPININNIASITKTFLQLPDSNAQSALYDFVTRTGNALNVNVANNNVGFSLESTQQNIKTVLDDMLLELKDDINASETVWYDKITPTLFYVRRSSTNQDTGVVTVSFYNVAGVLAAPIVANLVQVVSVTDYEFNTIQRKAITTGVGYSVNDRIQELQIINMSLATLVNTIWVNKTTDTIIATPTFSHLIIDDSYSNSANQVLANTKLDQIHADLIAPTPAGTNSIGQVTANAGTNLNTSLLSLESTQQLVKTDLNNILANQTNKTQSTKLTNGVDDAQIQNTIVLGTEQGLITRNITDDIASTKAKQDVQIGLLDNIDVKLDKLNTSTNPFNVFVVNPPTSSGNTADSTAANQTLEIAQLNIIQTNTNKLDVNTSTRASEVTLAALNTKVITSATGIRIDGSASIQPISATSLPLPTNASTSTLQNTGNGFLGSIDVKTPSIGQALVTASSPVVLPISQITALTPPAAITGFNLEATQLLVKAKTDNLDVALSTRLKASDTLNAIGSITNTVVVKADTLANQVNAFKVDGSAVTQPISAVSLPLPTGSATAVLQGTGNTSLASIDTKLTGVSTSALQTTGNTALTQIQTNTNGANLYLSNIDTKVGLIDFKTPSLGQQTVAASSPVVLPIAQITALTPPTNAGYALDTSVNSLLKPASTLAAVTTLGTITNALPIGNNTIGNTNQTLATAEFAKITDGVNTAAVKAANISAVAADPAIVVAISPNNGLNVNQTIPTRGYNVITNASGSATVAITGANISATTVDSALIVGLSPNSNKTGSEQGLGLPLGIVGSVIGGGVTTTAPTYVTGNFQQLSLNTAGGLRVENNTTQINGQPVAIQNGILNNATQRVVLANRVETLTGSIAGLADIVSPVGARIKTLTFTNNTAAVVFVQIHNKVTPLVTGDIPLNGLIFRVPALATLDKTVADFGEAGILYGTNTHVGLSSTFGTFTAITTTNTSINVITVA